MSEITCANAVMCARLHRLGEHACANCDVVTADEPVNSVAEPVVSADGTDENETTTDDHGNEGSHLYRVKLTKTEYYSAYVEIAADNEGDARERATECDDVDWEYDDCEWDYPVLDEQLS